MSALKSYQRFATRCLEEARKTSDSKQKSLFIEMAQEWQRLAETAKSEKNEQNFQGPDADPGD